MSRRSPAGWKRKVTLQYLIWTTVAVSHVVDDVVWQAILSQDTVNILYIHPQHHNYNLSHIILCEEQCWTKAAPKHVYWHSSLLEVTSLALPYWWCHRRDAAATGWNPTCRIDKHTNTKSLSNIQVSSFKGVISWALFSILDSSRAALLSHSHTHTHKQSLNPFVCNLLVINSSMFRTTCFNAHFVKNVKNYFFSLLKSL